jgi:hypothetical protein
MRGIVEVPAVKIRNCLTHTWARRGHEKGIIVDRVPSVGIEGRRVGFNEEEERRGRGT